MKIGELRLMMAEALSRIGLEERALFPKGPKAWCLPGGDVVRFFQPAPYRKGWGFIYAGVIGVELPQLRAWILRHGPGQAGIFHHSFVAHHTLNDNDRERFMVTIDEAFSPDNLALALREKLVAIPPTAERLIACFKDDPLSLGGLTGPIHRPAWDFLQQWIERPDDSTSIPKEGPDGRATA